jgi:2-succinyl-5-enolpyruvyl-6-hydroxy-3-cyclohexene-1-carboxylate synthase
MMNSGIDFNHLPNLNYVWAGLLVEELVRNGVKCFCIAPGSRSSPLTVSAARHPEVETIVHYDERGLAFYALGRVSVDKQPVAIICSSGTAAVNFFPAIVETSKKKLPLIVLTADRPPELRNTGALQTIDQVKLYGNYVRWFTDMPTPNPDIKPQMVLTTVDQAVFMAKHSMPGPVHINCMFREPLAPDEAGFDAKTYLAPLQEWRKTNRVFTRYTTGDVKTDLSVDKDILSAINNARRGVIVVGKLASTEEQQSVIRLAEKLNWPVFPDIVSGLRLNPNSPGHIIHYFDQVLLSKLLAGTYPVDTVLHLGGRITSKRWYRFIEKSKPAHYITVLAHPLRNDPFHWVTDRVKSTVRDFAESILPEVKSAGEDDFLRFLRQANRKVDETVEGFLEEHIDVNEIGAARSVSRLMPKGHGLFLSNSMPVREMDMYAVTKAGPAVIGGNRGASGIDGIIATACGTARSAGVRTTLLTGDLAFLHDLNSLALVKTLEHPLIIVTVNNDGGGIFSFLPIAQSAGAEDIFDTYFGTPHGLDCSAAAKMFGLHYESPKTMAEFEKTYENALQSDHSIIIEVSTDRKENIRLHRRLQETIANILDNMLK